jgi:NAD(P)-dependent dehydrogenase (short-subunit alcohol dehydrogenase family)
MKARKFGRIVSISSRAILGKPARTVYSSTKAAMVGFTRTWALELGPHGITVNAIAPGPVETELFKKNNPPEIAARIISQAAVGRAGTVEDVGRAVLFFAHPDNGFITGQVLHVCGGTSLVVNW